MTVSASVLRQNIYKMLDRVLETGVPVEIERKNRHLRIVPLEKKSKLANLKKRSVMRGSPERLVHIDWSKEWKP
jgi:antitoxin (DNA-binding transcriptional repressor) of toxin-antitoxin stability system